LQQKIGWHVANLPSGCNPNIDHIFKIKGLAVANGHLRLVFNHFETQPMIYILKILYNSRYVYH